LSSGVGIAKRLSPIQESSIGLGSFDQLAGEEYLFSSKKSRPLKKRADGEWQMASWDKSRWQMAYG
jgi:hypothetical protein